MITGIQLSSGTTRSGSSYCLTIHLLEKSLNISEFNSNEKQMNRNSKINNYLKYLNFLVTNIERMNLKNTITE